MEQAWRVSKSCAAGLEIRCPGDALSRTESLKAGCRGADNAHAKWGRGRL